MGFEPLTLMVIIALNWRCVWKKMFLMAMVLDSDVQELSAR